MIFSLWIINRAGGLVYQRDLNDGLNKLNSNDYLVMAGTLHGVHAILSRLSPVKSSGLEFLQTNHFNLFCHQTPTGVKFLIFTDQTNVDFFLKKAKETYVDYALKNPFYTPDMPIRCELFDINILRLKSNGT